MAQGSHSADSAECLSTSGVGSLNTHSPPLQQQNYHIRNVSAADNNYTHHTIEACTVGGLQILFPTIIDNHFSRRLGKYYDVQDTGSAITLASEPFFQRIGVRRVHARISVLGLAANSAGVIRWRANFKLNSRNADQSFELASFILTSLTSSLPLQSVDTSFSTWNQIP